MSHRAILLIICLGFAGSRNPACGQGAFLQLSVKDFNAPGTSWRASEARKDYPEAGRLIEDYIARHSSELSEVDLTVLQFHAAQMFAFAGDTNRAIAHLPLARFKVEPVHWPLRWNDYVTATEAFLKHDRKTLLAAREQIATGPVWNGEAPGLNVVDSLIGHFDEPYLAAYTKAKPPRSQSPKPTP